MSLAIVFNHKQSEEWEEKLKELLPNENIEVYPNIKNFNDVDFIATWKPDHDVFAKFPNLKCIQSVGAGIDQLLGIKISNDIRITRIVDENLTQDMYEHILTCIMSSIKNFRVYMDNNLLNEWKPINYLSIKDVTITILGLGEIGKEVSVKLSKNGFKVKGWSNSPKKIDGVETYHGINELKSALVNSNFVVNILPLTSKTENILNNSLFSELNQATLINVGRGKHLNENDLIDAIENKNIKEAYLDVFQLEPLPENHMFWNHKNIFITPHIASVTNPNTAIMQVVENYKRLKNNEQLLNVVNLNNEY